ncbi:PTS ascorbate transporter subunit IIC [Dongshaea marina]|uniref:PTS ascorbate transporter subunit IIC n=1 Tax=Dongshaea marina TaxID=2047966 RepID=UPI000D3E532E|nr:PTS ascorbate transporter subunit IIC [Dongshaea marina]
MNALTIVTDIFRNPPILLGIVAFIGLCIQKKPWTEVISGTIKTIMGFVVLRLGGGIIGHNLDIFGQLFTNGFHIEGIIPSNEAVVGLALAKVGSVTALIVLFGMMMNILIARFTRLRYIYLSGHILVYMSCVLACIMFSHGISSLWMVIIGAIILGLYMSIAPFILRKPSRRIIGSDEYTIGHSGTLSYFIASMVGRWVGSPDHSIETVQMPQKLMFLKDSMVSVTITMLVLFLIVTFKADSEFARHLAGGTDLLLFSIIQAVTFTGGLFIVLTGVKMFINEIVPAYKGIAQKIVPGSVPAVDVAALFDLSPNAVIVGFIASFIGGLITMFILPFAGLAVIIPGLVAHFYTGAASAIYGNATGGRRGAMIGAFINGILLTLLPALLIPLLKNMGFHGTTFGDPDFAVVGIVLGYALMLF